MVWCKLWCIYVDVCVVVQLIVVVEDVQYGQVCFEFVQCWQVEIVGSVQVYLLVGWQVFGVGEVVV